MAAITCTQLGGYDEDYEDDSWRVVLKYSIRNAVPAGLLTSEDVAIEALLLTSPSEYKGLYRTRYRLIKRPSASGISYEGEVTYTSKKPENLVGSVISLRGRTERVKRMYAPTIGGVGNIPHAALLGAVNLDEKGDPQGLDQPIPTGELNIQVRVAPNLIRLQDAWSWNVIQTTVNSAAWGIFPAGSVQFIDYSFTSGDQQKDQADFTFAVAPPESFTFPTFDPSTINKEGHDYMSVGFRKYYDPTNKFIGSRLEYVAIHRPFIRIPFDGAFKYTASNLDIITVAMVTNF